MCTCGDFDETVKVCGCDRDRPAFTLVKRDEDAAHDRGEDAAALNAAALAAGFHTSLLYRSARPGGADKCKFFVALWGDADQQIFIGYLKG